MIRKAQRGELKRQQEGWNPSNPKRSAYKLLPARFALFYSWASMPQPVTADDGSVLVARTSEEESAFRLALECMQIWYAHQKLFAFLLTEPPERRQPGAGTNEARYDERGWPTVERAWTMIAKFNSTYSWPMLYDVGTGEEAVRMAPLHPEQVAEMLATKRFTSPKADM